MIDGHIWNRHGVSISGRPRIITKSNGPDSTIFPELNQVEQSNKHGSDPV
jgi:hypothetical protein